MEESLNISELFKLVKKRFVLIVGIIILCVTGAGYASYNFLTPIYEASTQILITQQKDGQTQFNSQDLQLNLQLINTYNVIITSPAILSKVIEDLGLDTTPIDLQMNIRVSNEQNSQVVNISVQDPSLHQAVNIANSTVEVFQEEIKSLMNVDNVKVLSPATYVKNSLPVKPDPILNMGIATIVGLMIGVGITFLLEYLDTTIKSEKEVDELFALPILGLVGVISKKEVRKSKKLEKQRIRKRRLGGV
ncbi:Wzz/FepE/Etk N-terminal domain-containing protein [Lederbergia citrisecunda]|uniref:YveK family protein n=1 Tax=Lederbergia citrisecunda TaxID=2833583 RepID=UPI0007586ED9